MGIRVVGPINSGVAVGGSGVATATFTTSVAVNGVVESVYVRYNDTPPATTDVTVATAADTTPAMTLLALTNANTTGRFYPRVATHTTAGGAGAEEATMSVADRIVVTIAQANAADSVDVWLILS